MESNEKMETKGDSEERMALKNTLLDMYGSVLKLVLVKQPSDRA
jgi:hypothetical protein